MASLTTLPADAEKLLDLFAAQLTAQGVQLPERTYVQAGSIPVWDGEQMTAGLMGIAQGQPGQAQPQSFVPEALNLYATFFVLLIRPVAVIYAEGQVAGEIPSAAEQDADGQASMGDGAALVLAGSAIHRASMAGGTLALTGPGEGFVIDGLQPLGPEGGLAGNRLLISISLS